MATTLHDPERRRFASDNEAGAHPDVLAAVVAANGGHDRSYGGDVYTAALQDVVRARFGPGASAFPVFNGTGANVLGLQAMLPPWGAVITADSAHLLMDESTAPGGVGGFGILSVATPDGKLTPELLAARDWSRGDVHRPQPGAVSITQSTERGTVFTPDEVAAIADWAHAEGMILHMDGSRLSNAAAALDVPLAAFTTEAGVDVLSLGGTKNGMLFGEAVVLTNADRPGAAAALPFLRKRNLQLASKMRFVSAQLIALYQDDLYLRLARSANAMARRLAGAVAEIEGVRVTQPVQANAVFAVLPPEAARRLMGEIGMFEWNPDDSEARWVCAFDTTEEDVDRLVGALRTLM